MRIQQYIFSPYFKALVALLYAAFTAFTLSRYALLVQHLLSIRYSGFFEAGMVAGMLLFQLIFIVNKPRKMIIEYFMNVLLVSFIGSLMLWPLILLNYVIHLSDYINIAYFFLVVTCMFFNHKKRVQRINMPAFLSYTWVLYRIIILLIIL